MGTNSKVEVSVIIPTYNVAPYIAQTIKSALDQKDISLEVIIIDDLSTDKTVQIASSFQDDRIKIIIQKQNSGPGASRNEGIRFARGEWIAVLDGDDSLEPERIKRCINRALTANADVVLDNLKVISEGEGDEKIMFNSSLFIKSSHLSLADYIAGNCSFLGGRTLGYTKPIFRKSYIDKHNIAYPEDIRIGEDYIFLASMLAEGAVCVTEPSAGYRYLVRAGSTSHRLNEDAVKRIEDLDARLLAKYRLDGKALQAQAIRQRRLKEAMAFTRLVESIKNKNISDIINISLSSPIVIVYLWRPIVAKISRLARFGDRAQNEN